MNSKLSILLPIMESYANSVLDKGWKLPIPQNITKFILREKVEPRDGYLIIDGDVDFQDKEDTVLTLQEGLIIERKRE